MPFSSDEQSHDHWNHLLGKTSKYISVPPSDLWWPNKRKNGDTVDDFHQLDEKWRMMKTHYKKTSYLNYIIWISIQIRHPDQRFFQKQRTASLNLVFQKPLKTGGFHKRTSNKLVVLMVNYLFIYLFWLRTMAMHQRTGYVIFWEPWLWILRTLPWYNHQGSVSNNRPTLAQRQGVQVWD